MLRDRWFYIVVAIIIGAEMGFVAFTQQAIVNLQRAGVKELPPMYQMGIDLSGMLHARPVFGFILALIHAAFVSMIGDRRRSAAGQRQDTARKQVIVAKSDVFPQNRGLLI